jgi:hypothetical protein
MDHGKEKKAQSSVSGLNREKMFFYLLPPLHLKTPIPVDESHQL